MEYRYAIKKKIPVVTFIHSDISKISFDKSEDKEENRIKWNEFIQYTSKGKLVKHWNGKEDLAGKVSRTMISVIKRHPVIGWVRSNFDMIQETRYRLTRNGEDYLVFLLAERNDN